MIIQIISRASALPEIRYHHRLEIELETAKSTFSYPKILGRRTLNQGYSLWFADSNSGVGTTILHHIQRVKDLHHLAAIGNKLLVSME